MILNVKNELERQARNGHFLGDLTKTKFVPQNLSTGGPDFVFKKKIRQFLGCAPSARTWGTPDSDQKCISLAADYTTIFKAKVYFLWQI